MLSDIGIMRKVVSPETVDTRAIAGAVTNIKSAGGGDLLGLFARFVEHGGALLEAAEKRASASEKHAAVAQEFNAQLESLSKMTFSDPSKYADDCNVLSDMTMKWEKLVPEVVSHLANKGVDPKQCLANAAERFVNRLLSAWLEEMGGAKVLNRMSRFPVVDSLSDLASRLGVSGKLMTSLLFCKTWQGGL